MGGRARLEGGRDSRAFAFDTAAPLFPFVAVVQVALRSRDDRFAVAVTRQEACVSAIFDMAAKGPALPKAASLVSLNRNTNWMSERGSYLFLSDEAWM